MTHKCPAEGCTREVVQGVLMCPRHWRLVPNELRNRVFDEWNMGKPTVDYLAVRHQAVAHVNKELGYY